MSSSPQSAETLASGTATTNVLTLAATIASGVIDSTHPYYLHPYDYPGMNLVSSAFDGKGYGGWRREVIVVLSAKNKLGFIDGSVIFPKTDSAIQQAWARCKWSKVVPITKGIKFSSTGKFKCINLLHQWDELDALNTFFACVCECECGAKVKSLKAHQDERLLQFLMGLNDIFIGVRSNILLSSPLPSIGHAYSLVIQDEKQREIYATHAYPGESASFIATNQSGNFRKFNENKMQKISFESKRNTEICSYCKKPGHSIDKCYMIHGFPADFKFTRQKRFQVGTQANNAFLSNENSEQGAENTTGVQNLTKENVAELLQLLQQIKMGQNSVGTSDAATNVSCAGMTNFFEDITCLNQISDESWILDSGATEHMSFNKEFFINLKTLPKPLMVKLPNSYRVKTTHSGTVTLLPNLFLQNV
ncbi:uncharacterized protein [Nicotiana tomentosiformis]|uniref:uncharacterized protein n=1 Tax=Nicotiana tomentosiformis TaxID=4098 RepID=UPI00051BB864